MADRVKLRVTMELKSDAIFSAGYSLPGGADITVYTDSKGYPFLRGTSFKGLLRESATNLLYWEREGQPMKRINSIFGCEGWTGCADAHRLQLSALVLDEASKPVDPADCYCNRAFTQIVDGLAKNGSLRSARCIRKGLVFVGEIYCHKEDLTFITDAVRMIKWTGSMRNRGFGRVRMHAETIPDTNCIDNIHNTVSTPCYLHYSLSAERPILITSLKGSRDESYGCKDHIPGSSVRGMIVNLIHDRDPDWFEANKEELLSERTRFLNALPNPKHLAVIPSIKGFYENKQEENFCSLLLKDGDLPAGLKRAKLGTYCAIENDEIIYWGTESESDLRINRKISEGKDSTPFTTECLSVGQRFDGYIRVAKPETAEKIASVLQGEVWIGADRYEGYGKCQADVHFIEDTLPQRTYGYNGQSYIGTRLYMLALSPVSMTDENGRSCGLDCNSLAAKLGVAHVSVTQCSTSISEYGAYNRQWGCYAPSERMYDAGSIFMLDCSSSPEADKLLALQREGLGIRRNEGYGDVLFLRDDIYQDKLKKRKTTEPKNEECASAEPCTISPSALRRAKYQWIMATCANSKFSISKSQMGSIQAICEAEKTASSVEKLKDNLKKNVEERSPEIGANFSPISTMINNVLDSPLSTTLRQWLPDMVILEGTLEEKLELLTLLFDYIRKEGVS